MNHLRHCLAVVLAAASVMAAGAAQAYTNAVGTVGVTKSWTNSECWPTWDGPWPVEDNCTMPTADTGYGVFFCGRQVYGDIYTTNFTVAMPGSCDLGINLSGQKVTFVAGKITFGANSKMADLGGSRYYRCYAYALANGATNCPDPDVGGGRTRVLNSAHTATLAVSTAGAQVNEAVAADGVMCCGRLDITNGACGVANGVATYAAPSGGGLCAGGTPTAVSLAAYTYSWTCNPAGMGTYSASCSAPQMVDGACGSANGVATTTAPASGLCSVGSPSAVNSLATSFTWSCSGINGASPAACSAPLAGQCGTANGVASYNGPQTQPTYAFGGAYSTDPSYVNPVTGAKSCPSGYSAYTVLGYSGIDYGVTYCIKTLAVSETPAWDFGGMWGNDYAYNNYATSAKTCPAGFTQTTILGRSGVDYGVQICWRAHTTGDAVFFGGMWGEPYAYVNNVTGAKSCPLDYVQTQILGHSGVDYNLFFCSQKPANLCAIGTPSAVTTGATFTWSCTAGTVANCSSPNL